VQGGRLIALLFVASHRLYLHTMCVGCMQAPPKLEESALCASYKLCSTHTHTHTHTRRDPNDVMQHCESSIIRACTHRNPSSVMQHCGSPIQCLHPVLTHTHTHTHTRRDPNDVMQRKAVLEVREDKSGLTHVPSLLSVQVPNYAAVLQLLSKGNSNRAVRPYFFVHRDFALTIVSGIVR